MKRSNILIIIISACFLIILFFILFGFTKVEIYPYGMKTKFFRKSKNEHTSFAFLKPSPSSNLEREDLIIHKDPSNYDNHFSNKTNICSRLIGLPGDKIQITDTKVFVNDNSLEEDYDLFYLFRVTMVDSVNFEEILSNTGVQIVEVLSGGKACNFVGTQGQADEISKIENIVNVRKNINIRGVYLYGIFPSDPLIVWNPDNFGPLIVPKKGTTVKLDRGNIAIYKIIIDNHEENELFYNYSKIEINGKIVNEYTFKKDYFFVLNDNRYENKDSKTWGFIPEDQIVGKVLN